MQLNKLLLIIIVALLFSFPLAATATPPPNIQIEKQALMNYHDSGQYNTDIEDIAQKVMRYSQNIITKNTLSNHPKKLAAVFDIDETILSNYPSMRNLNFGGSLSEIISAQQLANDPAIIPMKKLYQFAQQNNIAIFLVTGRMDNQRQNTIKNLHKAGYKNWKTLFTKPNNYHEASVAPYKSGTREKITKMGYEIIFNIGDQQSDLDNGYADKQCKLPNPFYSIP